MKKCLGIFIASIIALGMSSCSEDFDIAAPYKDITVVYGLMDVGQPVQYIRIQKAFLDVTHNALDVAKIPDSNFFRNLTVLMKQMKNGQTLTVDTLQKVDLDPLGIPKMTGVFFSTPNLAYRYSRQLVPSSTYRLIIINNETLNVDSADTKVIDTSAANFSVSEFNRNKPTISFEANNDVAKYLLNISPAPDNAAYFEGYIKFNYVNVENGTGTDTFFVWNFGTAVTTAGNAKVETTTKEFFNAFTAFIPKADANLTRLLDSADVYVWAADNNYFNYMINTQSQGGITADQIHPIYTTIRGKDVLGVFGSRAKRIRYNIPITEPSLDSLKKNQYTSLLRFTGRSDH